jgi:hypothetical protein
MNDQRMNALSQIKFLLRTAFIPALFALSCKKENLCDCVKSVGEYSAETRSLNGFTKINTFDDVNLFITQDSVYEVIIEGGENLIPLIKTEVIDGELQVHNKNKCNWVRSYKNSMINLYIRMPAPTHIKNSGVGKIKSLNTLVTDTIDLWPESTGDIEIAINCTKITGHMTGEGDLIVSGSAYENAVWGIGNGFLRCENLSTAYTWIFSARTGDSYVRASDLLIVYIRRNGNIYYYGSPASIIVKEKSGTGELIGL